MGGASSIYEEDERRRKMGQALSSGAGQAGSLVNTGQAIDNTLPVGVNPIQNFSTTWLGYQTADNSCSLRDLGFTGQLGGKWYSVWGDVNWGAPGTMNTFAQPPGFHGLVRNAISLLGDDPLIVHDLHLNDDQPVKHQQQLVPWNSKWGENQATGFGGTSICEVDSEAVTGALYYLVNFNTSLVGAGVAKLEMINDEPTVTHRYGSEGYWWPADNYAHYGDKAAYRDEQSDYIYIWGGPPNYVDDPIGSQFSYLARVKAFEAFDLQKYEYFWGRQRGWRKEVLDEFTAETAVTWGVGQGQVMFNKHLGCYLLVNVWIGGPTVRIRAAPSPEGPWTADVDVYTAKPIDNGLVYAGIAHPYLDPSGRSIYISYTNHNHIEVVRVDLK